MITDIPPYALRAYALFYGRYGAGPFRQSALDWVVGSSMRKKIFATLVHAGWIAKQSRAQYTCVRPEQVMQGLLEFKVPSIMRQTERPYAFTGLSAVEIWSDFSYVQRSRERSPYFIAVLRRDLPYWKQFFSKHGIPSYVKQGSTIGEFIIFVPQENIQAEEHNGMRVEPLQKTMDIARANEMYAYPYQYMREKYGSPAA